MLNDFRDGMAMRIPADQCSQDHHVHSALEHLAIGLALFHYPGFSTRTSMGMNDTTTRTSMGIFPEILLSTGNNRPTRLRHAALPFEEGCALFVYTVCEFFDDGVGEDFAGDALDLGAGGLGLEPISKRQSEIFALANGGNVAESDLAQGIVDGLALWIEDRCL
jgi:hypothetical protein